MFPSHRMHRIIILNFRLSGQVVVLSHHANDCLVPTRASSGRRKTQRQDCEDHVHSDPAILKSPSGRADGRRLLPAIEINVGRVRSRASVHKGQKCVDCHRDAAVKDFPHPEKLQPRSTAPLPQAGRRGLLRRHPRQGPEARRALRPDVQGMPRQRTTSSPATRPRVQDLQDEHPRPLRDVPPGGGAGRPGLQHPRKGHPQPLFREHPRRSPLQERPDRHGHLQQLPRQPPHPAPHVAPNPRSPSRTSPGPAPPATPGSRRSTPRSSGASSGSGRRAPSRPAPTATGRTSCARRTWSSGRPTANA